MSVKIQKRIKRTQKDVYFEWLLKGVLLVSEWAAVQIAIFTPDFPIPIPLFVLWIAVQVAVSFFLLSQLWQRLLRRQKEVGRLVNIVVICIVVQGLGIFRSHQLFAGAAAIADSFLLYLAYAGGDNSAEQKTKPVQVTGGDNSTEQKTKPVQVKSRRCIECRRPLLIGKDRCALHAHRMKRLLHTLDKVEKPLGSSRVGSTHSPRR